VKLHFEIVLRKKSQNVKMSKSQAVTSREFKKRTGKAFFYVRKLEIFYAMNDCIF
jgi:hypothetical protein